MAQFTNDIAVSVFKRDISARPIRPEPVDSKVGYCDTIQLAVKPIVESFARKNGGTVRLGCMGPA